MGWLFSTRWYDRRDLIKHLTTQTKTLKHCTVGNHLWCVHEYERKGMPCRFICLYILARHGKGQEWGYKDVDETMGPNELSCPVSYLEMCTAPEGIWAYGWRQRVYERARKIRGFKIGSMWVGEYGRPYKIIKRVSPKLFHISNSEGVIMRASVRILLPMQAYQGV